MSIKREPWSAFSWLLLSYYMTRQYAAGAFRSNIGPDPSIFLLRPSERFPGSPIIYNPLAPLICLKVAGHRKEKNHSPESAENPAWHSESRNPLSRSAGAAGTVGENEELKSEMGSAAAHEGRTVPIATRSQGRLLYLESGVVTVSQPCQDVAIPPVT